MVKVSSVDDLVQGSVFQPRAHDSAEKHVTGEARYIDDLPEPSGLLHVYVAMSERAHARVTALDLEPVLAFEGVDCVLSAADIPGLNDASPVAGDDPVFVEDLVEYVGQPLFAVASRSPEQAARAAAAAVVTYEDLPPLLTVEAARKAGSHLLPGQVMRLGDAAKAVKAAPHRLSGRIVIGGQDHFYLEGQVSMAIPQEDGDMLVYCSTQHPSEVQHNVAKVLGLANNAVTVEVRRMGGGFGGKESQPAIFAAIAALTAAKAGRPAKVRLDRDDDMIMTGKRHDFVIDYEVGFDAEGRIQGVEFLQAVNCGRSADLSAAIADRAMFHADNAYRLNNATITSERLKTHKVSNTAFRGFGGPQGMVGIERMVDAIAMELGIDPLDVRKVNFYGQDGSPSESDVTPYHMTVEDAVIAEMVAELETSSDYRARRAEVADFNRDSPWIKKGIALTPVKFGISFTTTHLNQAGALLHVYNDGSLQLNHGGTEMGQGLYVKVAQVVAETLQVDIERVKITATSTAKVPNTSATAASSGSDLNGKAAEAAALTIKKRLIDFAARQYKVSPSDIEFLPNRVRVGNRTLGFGDLVKEAYLGRVSLSATGFYKTPKIHYDKDRHQGRPFFYFAYGAAVSEVAVDTLTGEYRVLRADLLEDVGQSLNPAVDLGQIEGGFIQGMGWLTMEELWWDDKGRLRTHAPSTYKIPACGDRPADLRIKIWDKGTNREETIFRSKAVGEPPLMLALSVLSALTDAVASVGGHRLMPNLDTPATPERVLLAVEDIRARLAAREAG